MTQKHLLVISILITLILSACGGEATPAISAADIANTAVADAWIAITQTQAAMPTATLVPPTSTPQPTVALLPTLVLLPTLPAATVVAPTSSQCDQVPPAEPKGILVNVEFKNESQGQVNLAFGMNTPNDKGECVTYSYGIGRGDASSTKVLTGCYWGYAWITGDEPSVARTGSTILCLTDASFTYHIVITKERIEFK